MFIRWQSRTRRFPSIGYCGQEIDLGDGIYRRARKGTSKLDVHHRAILYRSGRINGKPRQQYLAYLGGITDSQLSDGGPHIRFWHGVDAKLKKLGKQVSKAERRKIESELAKRIGRRPTKAECRQSEREFKALLEALEETGRHIKARRRMPHARN